MSQDTAGSLPDLTSLMKFSGGWTFAHISGLKRTCLIACIAFIH